MPTSPSDLHTEAPEAKDADEEREPHPAVASFMELRVGPAGPARSPSQASTSSHGSLSDLSRPPSSLFSRSTDLASGRSSVLPGKTCSVTVELALALASFRLKMREYVDYFIINQTFFNEYFIIHHFLI